MTDFRAASKSIRKARKMKKLIILIIFIFVVVIFIERKVILEKFALINDKIISMVYDNDVNIINKFNNKKLSAEIIHDEMPSEVEKIDIESIDSDTFLIISSDISFAAENMIDGDLMTSWQDGADDFGEGGIIKAYFKESTNVSYIIIYNGNQSCDEEFERNNRLKLIRVSVENQTVEVELEDTMEPQIIKLCGAEESNSVSLEICSVYEGTEYNDTCIAEIEYYR